MEKMKFSTETSTFQTNYKVVKNHSYLHVILILLSFFTYIATIVINALAAIPGTKVFEQPTSNISAKYETAITPAGWTFSTWGAIYIWQGLWLIYNITMLCRETESGKLYRSPHVLTPIFHLFIIANLSANIAWLFVWDQSYENEQILGAAFGLLVVIVATLYVALFISHRNLYNSFPQLHRNNKVDIWLIRILVHNGLAFYAAWVSIAMNLNLAIALQHQWKLSEENAALIALGVLTAIILIYFVLDVYLFEKYLRYTWSAYIQMGIAFAGVLSKHWNLEKSTSIFSLILTIIGPIIMFAVKIVVTIYRHRTSRR